MQSRSYVSHSWVLSWWDASDSPDLVTQACGFAKFYLYWRWPSVIHRLGWGLGWGVQLLIVFSGKVGLTQTPPALDFILALWSGSEYPRGVKPPIIAISEAGAHMSSLCSWSLFLCVGICFVDMVCLCPSRLLQQYILERKAYKQQKVVLRALEAGNARWGCQAGHVRALFHMVNLSYPHMVEGTRKLSVDSSIKPLIPTLGLYVYDLITSHSHHFPVTITLLSEYSNTWIFERHIQNVTGPLKDLYCLHDNNVISFALACSELEFNPKMEVLIIILLIYSQCLEKMSRIWGALMQIS